MQLCHETTLVKITSNTKHNKGDKIMGLYFYRKSEFSYLFFAAQKKKVSSFFFCSLLLLIAAGSHCELVNELVPVRYRFEVGQQEKSQAFSPISL